MSVEDAVRILLERLAADKMLGGKGLLQHDESEAIAVVLADLARLREAERWVPVTERLPDDLELVEVKGTSDNPHRHGRDMCWLFNGVWTSWFVKDITHWRPLPAGPEEEI